MHEYIGTVAGLLTTLAFFPQVVRTLRTQSTSDLSASWLLMMTAGVSLWVVYGSYLGSMPIMVANIVTLFCLILLIWAKFFRR